jgi:hypothetical protein
MFSREAVLATAAILFALAPTSAQTEAQRMRYDVSLLGLPIARAVFESRINESGFAVAGSFSSAGIARIFDKTDGTVSVTGRFGDGASRPRDYSLEYVSGKKKQITQIRFNGSRVTNTINEPPLKKRGGEWVPLQDDHLQQVADPISALLLPAPTAEGICNRTIRVYDGETRVDLVLTPAAGTEQFRQAEVTCRAQFVPVAGYRPTHSTIVHLRDRANIRIGFARVSQQGLYSPVEASIGTKIGTVHVRARPA